MHIIPSGISPDHVALAVALAAGAGTDPAQQAAIGILLRTGVTGRDDIHQLIVHTQTGPSADADTMAWPRWRALTSHPAISSGKRAALRYAASLAGEDRVVLGDVLSAVSSEMRAVLVEAIAHACGVRAGDGRPDADGSEPVPDGVAGYPVGSRREVAR